MKKLQIQYDAADYSSRDKALEVIGCIINNPSLLDDYSLSEKDFENLAVKAIFKAVDKLHGDGSKFVDSDMIEACLEKYYPTDFRIYQRSQGINFVGQAVTKCHPMNFEANYNELKKWRLLRDLMDNGINVNDIYNPDDWADDDKSKEAFMAMSCDDIIKRIRARLDKIDIQQGMSDLFKLQDSNDIECKPVEWLVDGLLFNYATHNIVAESKAGKSFLANQLALCLQNGIDFLRFKIENPCNVLLVDFEMDGGLIKDRCDKIYNEYSKTNDNLKPYKVITLAGTGLDIADARPKLEKIIEANEIKMIILDCWYKFSIGDEISGEDTKNTMKELAKLAKHCAVLYVHHTNKMGINKDNTLNSAGGSVVHSREIGTSLVLSRPKDGKSRLYYGGRQLGDHVITLDRTEDGVFMVGEDESIKNPMNEKVANLIKKYLNEKKQAKGRAKMSSVLKAVPEANGLDYTTYDSFGLQVVKMDGQRFNNWTVQLKDNFGGCGC